MSGVENKNTLYIYWSEPNVCNNNHSLTLHTTLHRAVGSFITKLGNNSFCIFISDFVYIFQILTVPPVDNAVQIHRSKPDPQPKNIMQKFHNFWSSKLNETLT